MTGGPVPGKQSNGTARKSLTLRIEDQVKSGHSFKALPRAQEMRERMIPSVKRRRFFRVISHFTTGFIRIRIVI